MNIFYFAITHHSNRKKALACNKTWVQTLPNMHWYSDEPDPEMNYTVISYKAGNTYQLVTYRALLIFNHVLSTYTGYDWYVRLWDDNYFFKERLEKLLENQNPNDSVLIGKMLHVDNWKDETRYFYLGGGSVWVLSKRAFETWAQNLRLETLNHDSCILSRLTNYLRTTIRDDFHTAEDMIFSQCLISQGVQLVHAYGFENWYLEQFLP